MKHPKIITVAFAALMLNACTSMNNVSDETGGAVIGAVAGGLLGSMFGHGVGQVAMMGAGAVIGGVGGAEVGKEVDQSRSNPQ